VRATPATVPSWDRRTRQHPARSAV